MARDAALDALIRKLETTEPLMLKPAPPNWVGRCRRVQRGNRLTMRMRRNMVALRLNQFVSQQASERAEDGARIKTCTPAHRLQANLARTIITAPVAGRVTKLTAAKGGYAAVGQALMMFVPREFWVTANFKETQLNLMRPGQPVNIAIDAYPGRTFAGHVDSVQSGSGTAFSLLPAENATGNYVKIVQRVPVKITFDKRPDVLLGPGMSVVPTVKVR